MDKAYRILDGCYNNQVLFARNSNEARKVAWKAIREAELRWVQSFVDFRVLRAEEYDILGIGEGSKWVEVSKYQGK